jgi:hypothetical protein
VIAGVTPEFVAETSPQKSGPITRVIVRTDRNAEIPMSVNGEDALRLVVEYTCEWDHSQAFLAVRKASLAVSCVDVSEPLFRYEFVDAMSGGSFPAAHIHVHAHRDEFVYALFRGDHRKGRVRRNKVLANEGGKMPALSVVHFPVGGARMRPALEDVLQMVIQEFGVDAADGSQTVLDEGRARWRRHQAATLTRDAPAEALRVLRDLGYECTWTAEGPEPSERIDRLTAI